MQFVLCTYLSCSIVDVIPDGIDLSHVFIGDNHRDVKEGVNNVYQYRWVRIILMQSQYITDVYHQTVFSIGSSQTGNKA
jgi:hypothetical protein